MIGQLTKNLPPLAATIAPLKSEPVESLRTIARIGYRAVQLSATQQGMRPRDLDASARRGLALQLKQLGLQAAGLDLWIPPAHFADSAFIDRAIDAVASAAELAAALGRCPISLSLPESTTETHNAIIEVKGALSSLSAKHGVRVADHGLDGLKSTDAAESVLFIGIDPPALIAAGEDVTKAIATHASRVACARVVDLLRSGLRGPVGEPGESRLDIVAFAAALSVAGFHGSLVADARQWSDPERGLVSSLARWSPKENS